MLHFIQPTASFPSTNHCAMLHNDNMYPKVFEKAYSALNKEITYPCSTYLQTWVNWRQTRQPAACKSHANPWFKVFALTHISLTRRHFSAFIFMSWGFLKIKGEWGKGQVGKVYKKKKKSSASHRWDSLLIKPGIDRQGGFTHSRAKVIWIKATLHKVPIQLSALPVSYTHLTLPTIYSV